MGGGGEGGSNGGGGKELIETVLTYEGNISDPELPLKISRLIHHLRIITNCESRDWLVRKVEPWNSVRVTFSIPKEAAGRLHQLAQAGDAALRQLGILSVQVEGDQVVSLKVAGPNHETTEILIRAEGTAGPSNEIGCHSSNVARSVTQALGGGTVLSGFGQQQQHHQPHPVPQFRSPSVVGSDGIPMIVGRSPVVQQRPQGQGYGYSGTSSNAAGVHARHVQPVQSPTGVLVSGGSLSHTSVVARPVFPSNPPPPYPSQDLRQSTNTPQQQIASVTQVTGQQYLVTQANSVITQPPQTILQHSSQQLNSLSQTVSGSYRMSGSQVSATNNASAPVNRGQVRTQVSMIKNSPLLVGLLQQPEQPSSIVGPRNKCVTVNPPQSAVSLSVSNSTENGPISSVISSTSTVTLASAGTYIGRSKDGLTTHQQIFSGGSVITNSVPPPPPPPPRHNNSSGLQHTSLSGQPSPTSPASRLQGSDDYRRAVGSSNTTNTRNKPGHLQSILQSSSSGPVTKDEHKESNSLHTSSNINKKESQYLINPNTGLLEPRPNTDSSDSEAEGRAESPHEDQQSNSVASDDDESNLSAASRKETDHSDSDVSRVSVASIESKKLLNSDRGKSQDRECSPGSSWENNAVNTNPGEKIKLRLKLGKEQVAQTTIVGNANKKIERRELAGNGGINSQSLSEPRVPKLHIKLHSHQPIIIKSVEENEASNKKSSKEQQSVVRDDKSKRKSGRSKPRNSESDFESLKSKNVKFKTNKEKTGDEVTSQVLKLLESKKNKLDSDFEDSSFVKFKETTDSRVKVPRVLEVSKPSKVESKLRTRLKKPSIRKVGDLNSVGEIASHKIMETLPPSITKVAAMHTQQPHRNPNSLSPVPFSSISTNMFSGSSISASFSSSPPLSSSSTTATTTTTTSSSSSASPPSSSSAPYTCPPSGDHLKAELEKRGSEIISKSDLKVDLEKNSNSEILMSKLCMNNPSLKTLMNGDATHNEKVTINQMRFKRTGSLASASDFSPTSKLTIKRKNSEETHTLKALKKEGLGTVPTFLNSSVLINKVSPEKSSVSSLSGGHRQNDDLTEKLLKKVESIKGPLRNEIAGLKSNSDITIHSVSKNDILSLSKASEFDRRADLTIKTKSDVTKVGRVTCVDVMDRKALEEALKSSRNSSKRNDISFCKSTSSMVDRLRRWNSIDSSNSVPLNTHSQQQTSDSTNLNSSMVKTESKESDESESEKSVILSTVIEKVKTEPCVSQQSNTIINVNSDNDCDNSGKDNVDKSIPIKSENKDVRNEKVSDNSETKSKERIENESKMKYDDSNCEMTKTLPVSQSECKSLSGFDVSGDQSSKSLLKDRGKNADLVSSGSVVKSEVDSPEGTPKGEHGNAQGGEDSGIESMDALSEKSPNHSDQSPNRREDKECELFQDKCKNKNSSVTNKSIKTEDKDLPKKKGEPDVCGYSEKNETEKMDVEKSKGDDNPFKNNLKSDSSQSEQDNSLKASNSGTSVSASESVKGETSFISSLDDDSVASESKLKDTSKDEKLEDSDKKIDNSEKIKSLTDQICCKSKGGIDTSSSSFSSNSDSSNLLTPKVTGVNSVEASSLSLTLNPPLNQNKNLLSNITTEYLDKKADSTPDESLSSSQDNFLDAPVSKTSKVPGDKETNSKSKSLLEDIQVSTVLCSASLSINTTSVSVTSPKSSVTTSSNILVNPYISLPSLSICGGNSNQSTSNSSKENAKQGSIFSQSKEVSLPFNSGYKPSLLAITLSRPPGSSIVTSHYEKMSCSTSSTTHTTPVVGKSTANSVGNAFTSVTTVTTTSTPTISTITITPTSTSTTTTTTITAGAKIVSSVETQNSTSSTTNVVYCHSLSCNNNSLAYCNSFTTTTNTTTTTMIILAASTNSCSTAITPSTPNSTKVVTLKPSINQPNNSAINPPVGKTFRLVALPGINSMTPVASPVKGQLVTLKPVVGSGIVPTIAKSSQILQTLPTVKCEEPIINSPIVRAHATTNVVSLAETVPSQVTPEINVNDSHLDDLDFVGFSSSSTGDSKVENGCKESGSLSLEKSNNKLMSPIEEEPTPMRVHPPLYTYGNRERKKEVESDVEEKEKEEVKEVQSTDNSSPILMKSSSLENDLESREKEAIDPLKGKPKEKKLHALTIEIPTVENYPDDKRLTRSTRQSARLASPKVSSPAGSGELSPRSDKKSPANTQAMGKPSPLGTVRSSVSPALRVTKRRRHESESSSASNVSEDQSEPLVKVKRKANQEPRDEARGKNCKKELDHDREIESSDDESLLEEEIMKKRNVSVVSSTNEEEEELRPSSRTGRPVTKAIKRSRDRSGTSESQSTSRDTTPTRRTSRQNRVNTFTNVVNQSGTIIATAVTALTGPGPNSHDVSPERADSKDSREKHSVTPILDSLPKGEELSKEGGGAKVVTKGKKDGESDMEVASARRKTRSTTNAATTLEDANKRRRLSKEK